MLTTAQIQAIQQTLTTAQIQATARIQVIQATVRIQAIQATARTQVIQAIQAIAESNIKMTVRPYGQKHTLLV